MAVVTLIEHTLVLSDCRKCSITYLELRATNSDQKKQAVKMVRESCVWVHSKNYWQSAYSCGVVVNSNFCVQCLHIRRLYDPKITKLGKS